MTTTFRIEDGYKPELLIQFARDHLYAAEKLYALGIPCLDSAGFLAHLTLELFIKAYLLHLTGQFTNSHNLIGLYETVQESDKSFQFEVFYLDSLRGFDLQHRLRYPHPSDTPGVCQGDLPVLQHLVSLIVERLPSELQAVSDSSEASSKGHRVISRPPTDVVSEA